MPKPCHLCIRLVWLCQHKMVMMLQKQHIPLWLGDLIAILCFFFVAKTIYALHLSKDDLRTFLSRKWFTHSVRKVFARWVSPSGKFRLFWASALMWEWWGGVTNLKLFSKYCFFGVGDLPYSQYELTGGSPYIRFVIEKVSLLLSHHPVFYR